MFTPVPTQHRFLKSIEQTFMKTVSEMCFTILEQVNFKTTIVAGLIYWPNLTASVKISGGGGKTILICCT